MASERTVAVVPAAGRGERMGAAGNKVFLPLGDRPILAHTLGALEDCPLVDEVVLAVGGGEEEFCRREILEPFELRKVTGLVRGGATRQETVGLALSYIGSGAGLVVVHDGARPLLPADLLLRAIEAGRELGAVVVGLPVRDTIKRLSGGTEGRAAASASRTGPQTQAGDASVPPVGKVAETIDRRSLWQVQTPQVFWRDLLAMAYRRAADSGGVATDDAALVERLRHPVHVIPGSEENLKITTPLDLVVARAILAERSRRRCGR